MKRLCLAALVISLLFSALSGAHAARAQTRRQAPKPAIVATKGAFFAVSVSDLEASSRWYAEKLGLAVVMNVPRTDGVAVRVLEGGGLIVELIQHDDAGPSPCAATSPAMCHGLFKAGVLVNNLDKTLGKLKARGVDVAFGPFPAQPNQRANAVIRDNAGNLIQLFER